MGLDVDGVLRELFYGTLSIENNMKAVVEKLSKNYSRYGFLTLRLMGIEEQYLNLLKDILSNGVEKNTRSGKTIGVFGRSLRHHMKDGFPLMTTRKMNFNNVKVEAIWMLSGNTNIKFLLENNCRIWTADAYRGYKYYVNKAVQTTVDTTLTLEQFEEKLLSDVVFAHNFGELGFTYGQAWREWPKEYGDNTIDQIDRLVSLLLSDPDNRRMVVTTYNPSVADNLTLPPCHTNWQVWTRELSYRERLELAANELVKVIPQATTDLIHGDVLLELSKMPVDFEPFSEQDHNNELDYICDGRIAAIPYRELSISYSMRSVDIPLGNNIHLYAMILLLLAKEVGMQPGEVVANFNDTHIYENQIEGVKTMLSRTPTKLPYVTTSKGLDATPEDVEIHSYNPQPFIKFPLSVG